MAAKKSAWKSGFETRHRPHAKDSQHVLNMGGILNFRGLLILSVPQYQLQRESLVILCDVIALKSGIPQYPFHLAWSLGMRQNNLDYMGVSPYANDEHGRYAIGLPI